MESLAVHAARWLAVTGATSAHGLSSLASQTEPEPVPVRAQWTSLASRYPDPVVSRRGYVYGESIEALRPKVTEVTEVDRRV